jgi:hypothetical protein
MGRVQPFIRTCQVKVIDRQGHAHTFYFFFKNHCRLPINLTVKNLREETFWKGDIAILRASAKSDGVVNMRSTDGKLADFALKKCVFIQLTYSYSVSMLPMFLVVSSISDRERESGFRNHWSSRCVNLLIPMPCLLGIISNPLHQLYVLYEL